MRILKFVSSLRRISACSLLSAALFGSACSSDPAEQPDPEPEPPVVVADPGDLSADGTANCYLVHRAGDYRFDATVMGNGVAAGSAAAGKLAPVSADLLWSDVRNLIANVRLEEGEVKFTATDLRGNALIAVRDADGRILWSWHIWSTDYDPASDKGAREFNGVSWMDRNLGALQPAWDDAGRVKGLVYQWGRKDPFPSPDGWSDFGAVTIYDREGNATALSAAVDVALADNLANSTANPMTFFGGVRDGEYNDLYDWYTNAGAASQNDALWESGTDRGKTLFDPCPKGWRVPKAEHFSNLNNNNFTAGEDGGRQHRILGYFPAVGLRGFSGGAWTSVGTTGDYWTSTAKAESLAGQLHFVSTYVNTAGSNYRASALPVRCVSEEDSGVITPPDPVVYDLDIAADRALNGIYKFAEGSDGSSNYYFGLSDGECYTESDGEILPVDVTKSLLWLDLYGAASADRDHAVLPEGTYEFSSGTESGAIGSDWTFLRYYDRDKQEAAWTRFVRGTVAVAHTAKGYKVEASLVTTQETTVHLLYEGEIEFVDATEEQTQTTISNPVDATFNEAVVSFEYSWSEEGNEYDRYTIALYASETPGSSVLTDGYAMRIDLFTDPASTKEEMRLLPGLYSGRSDQDSPNHYAYGDVMNLMGAAIYYGTYCMEVRPTNAAVLYGLCRQGTVEVKRSGAQYEFVLDLTTAEGVSVKGRYPMGDVTFIDNSPEPPRPWASTLEEDYTLTFDGGIEYTHCRCFGDYIYPNVAEFDLRVDAASEQFFFTVLADPAATEPYGTYRAAADPANPRPGEFIPGSLEGEVRHGSWSVVFWENGSESGGAPAIDGEIVVSDAGEGRMRIRYAVKDDAEPQHTVSCDWTGEMTVRNMLSSRQ